MSNKNQKYIDISIEETTSGNKIENCSILNIADYLGITYQGARNAVVKGKYKNYRFTYRINPNYKAKTVSVKEIENCKNKPKEVENTSSQKLTLKYCFEILNFLDNASDNYGFNDLNKFIEWLKENKFIYTELK